MKHRIDEISRQNIRFEEEKKYNIQRQQQEIIRDDHFSRYCTWISTLLMNRKNSSKQNIDRICFFLL